MIRSLRPLRASLALVSWTALQGCETEPVDEIYFASPELVLVRGGDTLHDVALRRAVAVEDLRRWNGLGPDEEVEPGERLLVWYLPAPEAMIAALGDERVARAGPVRSSDGSTSPRSRSSGAEAARPVMRIAAAVLEAGPERKRINVDRTQLESDRPGAGLGAFSRGDVYLDGQLDQGLTDRVASLSTHKMERGAQLGSSSLGGGGTAEAMEGVVREGRSHLAGTGGPRVGAGAIRAKRLSMPPVKPCLSGPNASQLTSDHGVLTGEGLSVDQIRRALNGFAHHTMSCIPGGTSGTFVVLTEITVGCNGRVSDVWIADGGGFPANVTGCIAETLKYAGFPAHDLIDGLVFQYPIQYGF